MEDMDFKHLHVEFFMDAVENKRASEEAKRPIFKDVEKVRIRMAGDPGTELVAPAHSPSAFRDPASNHRLTYAELHSGPYEAFQQNIEYTGAGTPLSELPFLTKSKVKELQAVNVRTAEALAGLDGSNLQKLGMGARDLKNQAQAYLDKAAGVAEVSHVTQENEALKEQMAALQEQMAKLTGAPTETSPEDAPAQSNTQSPFDEWADQDIVNWIVDNGGEKPSHLCKHDTLVSKADALNETLRKQNEAA